VAEAADKLDRSAAAPIDHLRKSGSGFFGISELVAADEARWSVTKEAHLRGDARGCKLRLAFNERGGRARFGCHVGFIGTFEIIAAEGGGRRKEETHFRAVRLLG
jgi:hypothetical protein